MRERANDRATPFEPGRVTTTYGGRPVCRAGRLPKDIISRPFVSYPIYGRSRHSGAKPLDYTV